MQTTKISFAIKTWMLKEKKLIMAAMAMGFLFTLGLAFATSVYAQSIQQGIAQEVVRFHVLANSDSPEDQALKLMVRDGVLAEFKSILNASQSVEETKALLAEHLNEITACAQRIIHEAGYDYPATAALTQSFFPTKAYGDITFPAGTYEALRIEIGQASGQNWWCVMFPPLCYVDVTQKQATEATKQELKHILTEEEYRIVAQSATGEEPAIKVKFKIVEWWQSLRLFQ